MQLEKWISSAAVKNLLLHVKKIDTKCQFKSDKILLFKNLEFFLQSHDQWESTHKCHAIVMLCVISVPNIYLYKFSSQT